jgi:hypothetical protein
MVLTLKVVCKKRRRIFNMPISSSSGEISDASQGSFRTLETTTINPEDNQENNLQIESDFEISTRSTNTNSNDSFENTSQIPE